MLQEINSCLVQVSGTMEGNVTPVIGYKLSTQELEKGSAQKNFYVSFKRDNVDEDPSESFNFSEFCNQLEQTEILTSSATIARTLQFQGIELTTTCHGYQPTIQEWKVFGEELEGVEIKYFKLDGFVKLGAEHYSVIARLFEDNHSVKDIDLYGSVTTLEGLEEFKSRVAHSHIGTVKLNIDSDQISQCHYSASQLMVRGCVDCLHMLIRGQESLLMLALWNESAGSIDQLVVHVSSRRIGISSVLEGLKDIPVG